MFVQRMKKMGLRSWLVDPSEEQIWKLVLHFFLVIAGIPLFIYGFLFNAFPFFMIDKLVKKKVKNIIFKGTFIFGVGILFFPLVWMVETFIVSFFIHGWLVNLLILFSLPFAGKIAFSWYILLLKTLGRFRWLIIKHFRSSLYTEIHREKHEIVEMI